MLCRRCGPRGVTLTSVVLYYLNVNGYHLRLEGLQAMCMLICIKSLNLYLVLLCHVYTWGVGCYNTSIWCAVLSHAVEYRMLGVSSCALHH